jgi:hypothetical protein
MLPCGRDLWAPQKSATVQGSWQAGNASRLDAESNYLANPINAETKDLLANRAGQAC